MPASKEQLAKALIESYLNIRKDWWKLVDTTNNELKLPEAGTTERGKIEAVMDVLKKLDSAYTDAEWLKVIYDLSELEKKEEQTHDDRFFLTKLVVSPPLLLDVLRAIREILVSDNQLSYKLNEERASLRQTQESHELTVARLKANSNTHNDKELKLAEEQRDGMVERIASLETPGDYCEKLFTKMKSHDPVAKELEETCFADFSRNVADGKRNTELTKRVKTALRHEGRAKKDEASNTASPLSANSVFKKPAPPTGSRRRHRSNRGNDNPTAYRRRR